MASVFGEVRMPSSRAYDQEEEEDDNSPYYKYDVDVKIPKGGKDLSSAKLLIISHGYLATEYCERLLGEEEVGRVHITGTRMGGNSGGGGEDTGDFHARRPAPSRLFRAGDGAVGLCATSAEVVPAVSFQFVKKVLGLVSGSCMVVVLSSHHYSKLRGGHHPSLSPSDMGNCVTYSLCSPAYVSANTPAHPPLPQPAVLDSVPAAALTKCVFEGRQCVVYAAFTETFSTGEVDLLAAPFLHVFQQQPLNCFLHHLDLEQVTHRSTKPREEFDRYV